MIKHIIFDFDGTLANTFDIIKEVARKEFGEISDTDFELLRQEGISGMLRKKKIPAGKLPGLVLRITTVLKTRNDKRLFTGIPELLTSLNANYRLGVLSSNNEDNIIETLNREGVSGMFEFIYSDSSVFGKHMVMNRMCKKHNLKFNEIVYAGDEDRDIIAARKANITNIAVTWGFNSEERLRNVRPDFIAKSPDEIPHIINEIKR